MFAYSLEDLKENNEPAALKKAKKILSAISKFKVDNNCQKFAVALELKFRDIDKDVTPTSTPVDKVFDVPVGCESPMANWWISKKARFIKISSDDPAKSIESTMRSFGNGSRAIISVAWDSGRGHVFNLININNEIYLLDATANRCKLVSKSGYIKSNLDAQNSAGIMRADNLTIDKSMVEDTFSKNEQEFSLDDSTKRYISVTAALSTNGAKNKEFLVYRKGKKLGIARCLSIREKYGDDYTVWNYTWK